MERGVSPSHLVPRSLLPPYCNSNRTTSRYPSSAATRRGVWCSSSSVLPWSGLARRSSSALTTSRRPASAAAKRGVSRSHLRLQPCCLSAPASKSNNRHCRFPRRAAACFHLRPQNLDFGDDSKPLLEAWHHCAGMRP